LNSTIELSNYPAAQNCVLEMTERVLTETPPRVLIPMPSLADLEFISKVASDGLIIPILMGREGELRSSWETLGGVSIDIINSDNRKDAALAATQIINDGAVDFLLRGGMPIHEVVDIINDTNGLIISHAAAVVMPGWERFLVISDGGWIPQPTLLETEGIIQNCITLLTALGIDNPHIALLSVVEDINPRIPRTMDTASISQMARRGAFDPAIVDGPLRFDHAIKHPQGHEPKFDSPVTGVANAVIAGLLEEANILIKALIHIGQGVFGAVILGGRIPVAWHSGDGSGNSQLLSLMLVIQIWKTSKGKC